MCSPGTMRMRNGLQGLDSLIGARVFAGRRGPQHLEEPCEGSPMSSGTATTISSALFPQQPGWHQVASLGPAAPVSMCRWLSRPCAPVPSGESCGRAMGLVVLGSRDAVSTYEQTPSHCHTPLGAAPGHAALWCDPWTPGRAALLQVQKEQPRVQAAQPGCTDLCQLSDYGASTGLGNTKGCPPDPQGSYLCNLATWAPCSVPHPVRLFLCEGCAGDCV